MHDVVLLNRIPSDSAVLRRLPHLSTDAMRFLLGLLSFRRLTGRTGIVRMSEVIRAHGIAPKSAIINELFEAGVMGQRDDGIVVYHPAILAMMMPNLPSLGGDLWQQNNVVTLPVGNGKERHDQSVA